jgi:heme exporter protein D
VEETYSSTAFFAWLFLGLALLIPLSLWARELKRRFDNDRQIRQRERKRRKTEEEITEKLSSGDG